MYILQQMSTGYLMSLSCYSYESLTRPVCRESWRTWVNPSRLLLPALRPLIYFSFSARMGLCFAFTGDYSIYKSSSLKYILNQIFYRHGKSYRLVDRFLYHDYQSSTRPIGTPISGALLTKDFIWWRPIIFNGVCFLI